MHRRDPPRIARRRTGREAIDRALVGAHQQLSAGHCQAECLAVDGVLPEQLTVGRGERRDLVLTAGQQHGVVSGSGQAALTMPVMVPLADLLEINRENAILAYQFGDGFTNMIVPTNPVLIGVISVARLPYGTWFRWMIRYQLLLFLVGMILLAFSPFHTT